MSSKIVRRDISPLLQMFRKFIRGREWDMRQLRYQQELSPRPYPQPNLPQGPSDKVSQNYYYTRDGRRESAPPILVSEMHKQIAAGDTKSETSATKWTGPKPGNLYKWD